MTREEFTTALAESNNDLAARIAKAFTGTSFATEPTIKSADVRTVLDEALRKATEPYNLLFERVIERIEGIETSIAQHARNLAGDNT